MENTKERAVITRVVGIFEGVAVNTEEDVSEWKKNLYAGHFFFYADLRKRFGRIKLEEFLLYARRLSAIYNHAYGEINFTLHEGEFLAGDTKTSFFSTKPISNRHEYGRIVSEEDYTLKRLTEIFEISSSLVLFVTPQSNAENLQGSFAKIGWMRASPKDLLFYARGDIDGSNEIVQLLYGRMFPKVGLNFSLVLGQAACNGISP